jgi:hypothetical protein
MFTLGKEQKLNITSGIILLLYGIYIFAGSFTFTGVGRSGEPGPGIVPRITGIFIIGLSGLLLLSTVISAARSGPAAGTADGSVPADKKSIALTFALFALYMVALKPLGFVISSVAYVFLQMIALAVKPSKKDLVIFAIVSVVSIAGTSLIFVYGFDLMLPQGFLGL